MKNNKTSLINKTFIENIISIAAILAVVLYPCLFIYFQNAGEAALLDILPVTSAIISGSLLIFGVIYFTYIKNIHKASFAIIIGLLMFLNFSFIEKVIMLILPSLFYWHVAIILIFVCLALLLFLKNTELTIFEYANQIILLVFSVLIIINAITAVPVIVNKISNMNERRVEELALQAEEGNYPNIYYFIFDEYGGIDNLKRYCNYDNTPFYNKLREIGFNVSEQSRNECTSTYTIIPNLLNLDYVNHGGEVTDTKDIAIRLERMKSPVLFQLLLSNGYKINVLQSGNFVDSSQASFRFDSSYQGVEGSAGYYILQHTALYPFYRNSSNGEIKNLLEMIDYAKASSKIADSNLFTIGYFSYPHNPWFVDENGNSISGADRANYYNTDIYLGEVKYGNKFIEDIVLEIIKSNPDCVIILQSDHGFRWPNAGCITFEDWNLEDYYMRNILNAVYFRGEFLDIEGETGINTLRIILNNMFNTDLEMINPDSYIKK